MQLRTIKKLSARVPKERKKGWWKKWLVLVPLLSALAGLVYFLNLPDYQIRSVVVEGADFSDREFVENSVQELLNQRYLLVVPKSHIWLLPRLGIKSELEALPAVLDAKVDIDVKSRTLNIILTERKHEYVWCLPTGQAGSEVGTSDKNKCFYMDRDALVFAPAPIFEGSAFLRFYGLIDEGNPIGKIYLSREHMVSILEFIKGAESLGLRPVEVDIKNLREVHITLYGGTDLIVSLEGPIDTVASNLKTIIQSTDFKKGSGGIDNLSYLDLRYGTKAYWREK